MNRSIIFIISIYLAGCLMDKKIIPERYKGLITQNEYDIVINHSTNFIKRHGEIDSIEDGVIYVKLNGNDPEQIHELSLDNLIRYCNQEEDVLKWKEIIESHFTKFITQENIDRNDFEKCKSLLSLRIYPEYDDFDTSAMVYKVDFQETFTTLVFDFPGTFETIDRETIGLWKIPIDTLFEIAQNNINKQEIEISEAKENINEIIYTFFSGDYSSSYVRDITKNADFAIGEYGAFICIPTRGSSFISPIKNKESIKVLGKLQSLTKKFFDEDPGSISPNIYWYYNNKFLKLETTDSKINIPGQLKKMMN